MQGVIRLNRSKEFEEEDEDGDAREEKERIKMYDISTVVSAKNAARRWQTKSAAAGGETGQETKIVSV